MLVDVLEAVVLLLRRMPRYCRPADARGISGRDFDDFAEFQHYRSSSWLRPPFNAYCVHPADAYGTAGSTLSFLLNPSCAYLQFPQGCRCNLAA